MHCRTKEEALELLEALHVRFGECGLELHPGKTRIVYCKDGKRMKEGEASSFDFPGYTFRPRRVKNHKTGKLFAGFTPAISRSATKDICKQVRSLGIRNRSDLALKEIAHWLNPKIRGWINYYGKFCPSLMRNVYRHLNGTIIAWAMAKYEVLRGKKSRARAWMEKVATKNQQLFAHWYLGNGRFA